MALYDVVLMDFVVVFCLVFAACEPEVEVEFVIKYLLFWGGGDE